MQNKPLIMQACETLGVPPGIKVTDLRALVELKLRILPEGSKEANMTRLAYDLLSTKLPETRIQEYNQAAFEWAKMGLAGENQMGGAPAARQQQPQIQQQNDQVGADANANANEKPRKPLFKPGDHSKEFEDAAADLMQYNPKAATAMLGY